MRGIQTESRNPNNFNVSKANLSEGTPLDEIDTYADQMTSASFSRAVGTRDGGYLAKKFVAAFSHIVLDEEGSNCGTKYGREITIDKNTKRDYHLRYVISENGNLLVLTEEFINSNMGKKFILRSPMYCKNERICNKCAGDFYYNMGTKNIGQHAARVGTKVLNASLKSNCSPLVAI